MSVLIEAPTTGYDQSSRHVRNDLQSLRTFAEQITASISGSFKNAGAGIGSSLGSIRSVAQSISSIGPSAQVAAAHVNSLTSKFTEGQAALRGYDARIAEARSSMAALNQKITEASHAATVDKQAIAALQKEYDTLSASTRVLVSEKGKLAVENRSVGVSLKAEEAALKGSIAATNAAAAAKAKLHAQVKTFSDGATSAGRAMSIGLTAPLTLMAHEVIKTGSSFESAFAGVRKTVDATEPQLAVLRQGFRDLAQEIPVTASELAKIGESAGQLGVKTPDILGFTRVVADLGVATNLVGEEGAQSIARFANIIKNDAGPQFDRLGSTIVALGNAGASTEKDILEMGLRIAGAGKLAKFSEADILGVANALSSVGIEAEAGGSAISRVITKMTDSVKLGNAQLRIFAAVAGESTAQFKKHFEQDAAGALASFIEGLGKTAAEGKSLTPVLEKLELSDIRVSDALKRAAGSGDLFRESIRTGSQAWAENTALTKEATERYKTFESQVQLLENKLSDIAITIFDTLRPSLLSIVNGVSDVADSFKTLSPEAIKTGATVAAILGAGGPVLLAIGATTASMNAMVLAFSGPLGIPLAIGALVGLKLAGRDAATGLASMWSKITGDAASGSATMVSHINKVTDALQVSLAAYIGWRVAGVPGAIAGGIIGLSTLPKNPESPMSTRFPQPGTARSSNLSAQQEIERVMGSGGSGGSFDWKKLRDNTGSESKKLGAGIVDNINAGINSKPVGVPNLKGLLDGTKKGGGSAGKGMSKAMLDEFQAGSAGFGLALDKVLGTGDLSKLFDPITKGARAGAEQTKKALQSVAAGINEYFQSFNAGITVTPELLANFPKAVIQNLGIASGALMRARESQSLELIRLNEAYRTQGIGLQAILKDGVIVIQQTGKQTVDIIKENAQRVAQADNLTKVFQKAGGDLQFTLNERNQIIASTGQIAVQSAQGVNSRLTASLGPKMFKDINLGIAAEGEKLADTFINIWDNVKKDTGISSAETARLATEAFSKLAPDVQRVIKPQFDLYIAQLGTLKSALADIKAFVDRNPIFDAAKIQIEAASTIENVIRTFEEQGQRLGETQEQINKRVLDGVRGTFGPQFTGAFKDIGEKTLRQWSDDLNKLSGPIDGFVNKTLDALGILDIKARQKIKGTISDIEGVIATLPGSTGDSVRKFHSEFMKIFSAADAVVKLIQGLWGKERTGLAGIIQDIIGVHKTASTAATTSAQTQTAALGQVNGALSESQRYWNDWASAVEAANRRAAAAASDYSYTGEAMSPFGLSDKQKVELGLDDIFGPGGEEAKKGGEAQGGMFAEGFLAQVATIGTGIAAIFAGHKQGGIGGGLTGALGGMQAGATIGSMIMPGLGTAIGAIGGAAVGFLAGIFGGGKSELQKAQEAAQLQQAKDAIKISQAQRDKTLEEYKQSLLETASKAASLMDDILGHIKVPRGQMRAFFKDLNALMTEFAAHLHIWKEDSLPKAKAVAEAESAIVDAIGKSPVAFDAIHNHVRLVEHELNQFMLDYGLVITAFGQKADEIPNRLEKDAKKFAKRTSEVWEIIPKASEGTKAIFNTKLLDPTDIRNWGINVETQINALAEVFDHVDKAKLRMSGKLASSGLDTLNFAGSAGEAIRKAIGTPSLTETDLNNLFSGIKVIFVRTAQLATEIEPEAQAAAKALSDSGASVLNLYKAASEAFGSGTTLKDTFLVTLNSLGDGIKEAIVIAARIHTDTAGQLTAEVVAFSKDATAVVGLFGETAKSFADASITRDIYPATIENIANGIELAIRGIAGIRGRVSSEMLTEAESAATGINAALSVVANAGNAFKDLGIDEAGKPKLFSIQVVDNLISITEYSVNRIVGLAKATNPADLNAAVEFSNIVHGVTSNMADGLGFIKALAEQTPTSISSFDLMVSNFVNFDSAMVRSLEQILHSRSISLQIKDAAAETKMNMLEAFTDMAASLSAASIPSGQGGASFGATSIPSTPTLPPSFGATSGGGGAVSVTIQPGAIVITQPNATPAQIQEATMRGVLEAIRRGQIKESILVGQR